MFRVPILEVRGFDSYQLWWTMSQQATPRQIAYYSFIAVIAFLFAVQWGPGSKGCGAEKIDPSAEPIARVNGRPIPARQFAVRYSQQMDMMRRQGFPAELASQLGIDKQILDALVTDELLAQAAEKRGIVVSDAELMELLTKQPQFQREGVFSPERYRQYVSDYEGMTEVAFEARLRREMSSQRLLELVEQGAVVGDDEVKSRYLKEGNRARATFVSFSPTAYADKVKPLKDDELRVWAAAHDADIAKYYEENRLTYFVPDKVRARQVLIKVDASAPAEKKAEVKARAEALRAELAAGTKAFAEAARSASEDEATREKGGDLGWVERMQLPGPVAEKAFALDAGALTDVIESPAGFHIVSVEEKKPSEQRPVEAVRLEIASLLSARDRAGHLARAEAQRALEAVRAGGELTKLFPAAEAKAEPSGEASDTAGAPQARDSGDFNAGADSVPMLNGSAEVAKAVFARKEPGLLDGVQQAGDAFAVVVVTERKLPADDEFATKRAELRIEAIKAKQFELRESFRKSLAQTGEVVKNERLLAQLVKVDS